MSDGAAYVQQVPTTAARKALAAETPLYAIHQVDAFRWLAHAAPESVHAVVTDPPYGLLEYKPQQLAKMKAGKGGVWRLPPSFDGCRRSPLPRFTVLGEREKKDLRAFFGRFAELLWPVLVPGAHNRSRINRGTLIW